MIPPSSPPPRPVGSAGAAPETRIGRTRTLPAGVLGRFGAQRRVSAASLSPPKTDA